MRHFEGGLAKKTPDFGRSHSSFARLYAIASGVQTVSDTDSASRGVLWGMIRNPAESLLGAHGRLSPDEPKEQRHDAQEHAVGGGRRRRCG